MWQQNNLSSELYERTEYRYELSLLGELLQRCYGKQRTSDLVSLVFRERILSRVLVDATSNAESQNQIVTLTKLMYFNSLLKREKDRIAEYCWSLEEISSVPQDTDT